MNAVQLTQEFLKTQTLPEMIAFLETHCTATVPPEKDTHELHHYMTHYDWPENTKYPVVHQNNRYVMNFEWRIDSKTAKVTAMYNINPFGAISDVMFWVRTPIEPQASSPMGAAGQLYVRDLVMHLNKTHRWAHVHIQDMQITEQANFIIRTQPHAEVAPFQRVTYQIMDDDRNDVTCIDVALTQLGTKLWRAEHEAIGTVMLHIEDHEYGGWNGVSYNILTAVTKPGNRFNKLINVSCCPIVKAPAHA